jgi:hypothetical protein
LKKDKKEKNYISKSNAKKNLSRNGKWKSMLTQLTIVISENTKKKIFRSMKLLVILKWGTGKIDFGFVNKYLRFYNKNKDYHCM